jgi:hypothetical protein
LTEPNVGAGGTIYVGRNLGQIHAVNPDASERWVYTESEIHFGPVASPAGDVVLAGGRVTYGAPGFIKALDTADGSLLWRVDLPSEEGLSMVPFSRPSFSPDGRRAYITTCLPGQPDGSEYCYLYALDVDAPASAGELQTEPALVAAPNPFRGGTEIRFRSSDPRGVVAEVFDPSGRLVRSLRSESPGDGTRLWRWDGRDGRGNELGSGVYYLRLDDRNGTGLPVIRIR